MLKAVAALTRERARSRGLKLRLLCDLDCAAVQFNQLLHQRQTEPGTRLARAVHEFLNDPRLINRLDRDPGIGDAEQQLAAPSFGFDADCTARRGKLDRVRDQIEERLLEPPLIGLDRADLGRASTRFCSSTGYPASIVARSRMSLIRSSK
jgi:hypothetical protein